MKYFLFLVTLSVLSCNTSSSDQAVVFDSSKADGTIVADTTAVATDTTLTTDTLR